LKLNNNFKPNLMVQKYISLIYFWWGSLRERDHWGDPDVDGRIILRGIFRKWEGLWGPDGAGSG
jgi:hypothetical protein